jgi:hypothetical protein
LHADGDDRRVERRVRPLRGLGGMANRSVGLRRQAGRDLALLRLDDVQMSTGDGTTSFETDLGGWTPAGPPEGSAPNPNNYIRTESVGFEEGAIVSTDDTLYFGFGFEGISDAATRNEVIGASMDYLLS